MCDIRNAVFLGGFPMWFLLRRLVEWSIKAHVEEHRANVARRNALDAAAPPAPPEPAPEFRPEPVASPRPPVTAVRARDVARGGPPSAPTSIVEVVCEYDDRSDPTLALRVIETFKLLGGCPCDYEEFTTLCTNHASAEQGRLGWFVTLAMGRHALFEPSSGATLCHRDDEPLADRLDCRVCGTQWSCITEEGMNKYWIATASRVMAPSAWRVGTVAPP